MPLTTVDLLTIGPPVESPPGLVYSTSPNRADADDANSYIIKGPEQNIVVAELMGSLLAEAVGLPVPPVSAARHGATIYAGSRLVTGIRNAGPFLRRPELVANVGDLFNTIVVDAWLVNNDRNVGNCLAVDDDEDDNKVRLIFIDFEKSATLRGPYPIMQATQVEEAHLWPQGAMGTILKAQKPAFPPREICNRISSFTDATLLGLFDAMETAVGNIPWRDSSLQVLRSRKNSIASIVERIWHIH